jgi:hypothetical protein
MRICRRRLGRAVPLRAAKDADPVSPSLPQTAHASGARRRLAQAPGWLHGSGVAELRFSENGEETSHACSVLAAEKGWGRKGPTTYGMPFPSPCLGHWLPWTCRAQPPGKQEKLDAFH